jgi:Regulatory CLIP domain of proteinases/Trypsin
MCVPVDAQQQPCDLAQNECVPLKECDVLYKLFVGDDIVSTPEVVEMLEASRCDTVAADVCCPNLNETEVAPELGVRFGEAPEGCQTPNRQTGVCIPVRHCKLTLQLLAKINTLTREESNYLRQSQCGYQNRSPLVCCASDAPTMYNKRQNQPNRKNQLPGFERCGATSSNRIIGGRNAKVDEYPWLAMVEYLDQQTGRRDFHCGASLITAQFTLSAAHCMSSLAIPSRYKP